MIPLAPTAIEQLRRGIERQVHGLVGHGSGQVDLARVPGDPGLFGPGSASWTVHGDFTAMMAGGVAALLLQMLHPGALAGVWDHSDFRRDMAGRLRRTAQFISATTYGSTAEAERLIARVRAIHDRVSGVLPDGTPYSANDPALLTWVHVSEATSFLAAHMRYRDPRFPRTEQDRYYAEFATVAERLGARDVPKTRAEADFYLAATRPALRVDDRTREVARLLLGQRSRDPALGGFGALMMDAGLDLLPPWAAAMHGRSVPAYRRPALRLGVRGVGHVLRWALTDGSARQAQRRVGV